MAAMRPCVLVMPLYIYPLTSTTWQPLYDAIAANPSLDFLIIVNPNSGPGTEPLPGGDYIREVPRLNAFPNVRTVGYIAVDYCRKPLDKVCDEISTYANWSRQYGDQIEGLYVEGIFVDETHNHFDDARMRYLERLKCFVKDEVEGLRGDRLVIHNPGTPPEYTRNGARPLAQFGTPDAVCVSEVPYGTFVTDDVQTRLQTYRLPYACNMFQISGIPLDRVGATVTDLCKRGRYVFATDLQENFYESFGPSWDVFVNAVAAAARGKNEGDQLAAKE
ncbi:Spherulation-specific family 4 [Podospora conica]|nr:Spherulation-specific family 4 [Schizothecium conicum]